MGIRAYLKPGIQTHRLENSTLHGITLSDGRKLPIGEDCVGKHVNLSGYSFELYNEPPDLNILGATSHFTHFHSGNPCAIHTGKGIYEYRTAKAVVATSNGCGYTLDLRFTDFEDGRALFMALWYTGTDGLNGVTITPQPQEA